MKAEDPTSNDPNLYAVWQSVLLTQVPPEDDLGGVSSSGGGGSASQDAPSPPLPPLVGQGAASGLDGCQRLSAAPSVAPPPLAGQVQPGGPAPARPAAGIGWRARRPLHTSPAAGGRRLCSASLRALRRGECTARLPRGRPRKPAEVERAGGPGAQGQRPAGVQEGATRGEREKSHPGRLLSAATSSPGGSWRQEDGPGSPFFPGPLPSPANTAARVGPPPSRCQADSAVSLVSFAGGNKGW